VAGAVGKKRSNRIQNYATDTRRPSGSVIKPLSVYAQAIESGIIDWSTILSDTPIKEATDTSPAWPANANGQYKGDVTLRYAIDQSLNTVAIRVLQRIGNKNSFEFLKNKLKLNSLNENADMGDASLALGQMSRGVTLRELVAAYSIFEGGVMSEARSYIKVTDANGVVVLDNTSKREQVISEESAAIMTKLLQSVVQNGTAKGKISLTDKCEVAGKSGTTQNSADRYFIGYTPTLLAGVWSGFEYPHSLDEFGGNYSVSIWNELMELIYDKTAYRLSEKSFHVPETVQPITYDATIGDKDIYPTDAENAETGWFCVR
jgi:penicillin-binding protein 1A